MGLVVFIKDDAHQVFFAFVFIFLVQTTTLRFSFRHILPLFLEVFIKNWSCGDHCLINCVLKVQFGLSLAGWYRSIDLCTCVEFQGIEKHVYTDNDMKFVLNMALCHCSLFTRWTAMGEINTKDNCLIFYNILLHYIQSYRTCIQNNCLGLYNRRKQSKQCIVLSTLLHQIGNIDKIQ